MAKHHSSPPGFTLIELSIVLVIIGLIVGGVLAGRDLILQSEIRSVITDIERFKTSIRTFQGKYECLPGDCLNATRFFGTASGGCPSGSRNNTETCNGNGNNLIDCGACDSGDGSVAGNTEIFLLWQHLAISNLLAGRYSGVTGPDSNYNAVLNVNVPSSKMGRGGYLIGDMTHESGDPNHFASVKYSQVLFFGGARTGQLIVDPVVSPNVARMIDRKVDDGTPGNGSVITFTPAVYPDCTTTSDPTTSQYNISYTGIACPLFFNGILQ